jgi:hypothetical protein
VDFSSNFSGEIEEFVRDGLKIFKNFRRSQQSTTWPIWDPATVYFFQESWPTVDFSKKKTATVDLSSKVDCRLQCLLAMPCKAFGVSIRQVETDGGGTQNLNDGRGNYHLTHANISICFANNTMHAKYLRHMTGKRSQARRSFCQHIDARWGKRVWSCWASEFPRDEHSSLWLNPERFCSINIISSGLAIYYDKDVIGWIWRTCAFYQLCHHSQSEHLATYMHTMTQYIQINSKYIRTHSKYIK